MILTQSYNWISAKNPKPKELNEGNLYQFFKESGKNSTETTDEYVL